MSESSFWNEVISIYTDADALDDGLLTDVSELGVKFNGRVIDRLTCSVVDILEVEKYAPEKLKDQLTAIAEKSDFDPNDKDSWGVFEADLNFGNSKFWLIPNENDGYTLMTPMDY